MPTQTDRPLLIAHRGANRVAPENSLPAITKAAELGADRVEIDVQLTRDGVPVLLHDWTVNRTTDGAGSIASLTWHQARQLKLRGPGTKALEPRQRPRIPTLEEAIAAAVAARLELVIELKGREHKPELARKTVSLLEKAGLLDSAWIWSFNWQELAAVRALTPRLRRGTLSIRWPGPDGLRESDMIVPFAGHQLLVRRRPAELEGRPLVVWTVNRVWMAKRFMARGAYGLITDVPDVLRAGLGPGHAT